MFSAYKMQDLMSLILLIGTMISLGLVLVGGILYLVQHGGDSLQAELIQSDTYDITIRQIWLIALSFTPLGIIELGLLLLVLTQILRVALLVCFYAISRDLGFTLISLFILFVLIYSFVWRD